MVFFYNILIFLYYLAILFASLFSKKAKLWIQGRKKIFTDLLDKRPQGKLIWMHVASLGEYEQGRPVLEKLRKEYPAYKICVSFFSPSGYQAIKNNADYEMVVYLPLDTKKNASKFIDIINPELVLFVRYEFWYHYIKILKNRKIPNILLSATFRANQVFFKWYGSWYRKLLHLFTIIFVQNKSSKELLRQWNIESVISGDTRIDRVYEIAQTGKQVDYLPEFTKGSHVLILGSAWPDELKLLYNYINTYKRDLKYIIAPHLVHNENIEKIQKELPLKSIRYSQIEQSGFSDAQCLIIDTIGILPFIYQYADVALIGGGFLDGIHSILEPASFGIPVIFGPDYKKFNEAIELVNLKASFSINNQKEFNYILNKILNNNDFYKKSSALTKEYIYKNRGASERIMEFINQRNLLSN